MKHALLSITCTLFYFSGTANAAYDCDKAPQSQKAAWQAFRTYLTEVDDISADMYVGAAFENAKEYATRPGNDENTLEVGPIVTLLDGGACIKSEVAQFNRLIKEGHESAIRLIAVYSAYPIADGAFGEALQDVQAEISKNFPKVFAKIKEDNAAFFKAHPLKYWGY